MTTDTRYALQLDRGERDRYRMMAAAAREAEGAEWTRAGIGPGASVADVGCGPGAVLRLLAEAVGRTGRSAWTAPWRRSRRHSPRSGS